MKKKRSMSVFRNRWQKLFFMMRISVFFFIAGLVQVSASVYSQQTNLILNMENARVEEVLKNIEDQSKFYFLYRSDLLKDIPDVNIRTEGSKVEEILDRIVVPYGFTYEIDDRIVVIKKTGEPAYRNNFQQQTRRITGTIRDEDGNPMPGVSVVVKGTTTGIISDLDGRYALNVPTDARTLVFSFVGMESQEIEIRGRTQIDVEMKESLIGIDEVVVVGYGVQRKSDITGSITSVDVEKLRDVPSASISKSLQGKAAGVEIQNTSTRPGGSTQIRIRGNRSLSASNDPLIVLDGIPFSGSLNDISSDDIASIEVLKDASATVIYGSRGSNGVIIITTKRGTPGKLKVNYNGYYGITTVAREYDVYNAEEFVNLRSAANYTDYLPGEKESMLLGRETDWQDLVYQDGSTDNHEITLSGGTETSQYAITGGYYRETGVLPEMAFKRYNLRVAIDQAIGKYVKIGLTTMSSYGITDGQSANPMWSLISLSPLSVPYNEDGTLNERPAYPTEETYNPLTLSDHSRWKEQNRRYATFNTFYGEVRILEGLKYRLNLGVDFSDNKYNNYYGSNTPFKNGAQNTARVENSDNKSYTIENLVTYDKTFAEKHRLSFTGMFSVQESTSTGSQFDATNVPVDYIQYHNMDLAEVVDATSDNNYYSKWSLMSYMGRINYAYKDRYMLTVTGRADGSSRLAPGNKWHYYPAAAVGWNIVNEPFMKNVNVVSNLKLRFGYGQTSNTAINPYSTLGGLSGSVYNFGEDGVKGYYVSTLPNSELGWEYTKTTNIGLDFALFEGRLSGSVDAYKQKTDDLLLGKKLPASQGVPGAYTENVGETENKGLEVVLNGIVVNPKKKGDFSFEVNANLFLNREKIVALQDPGIPQDVGNGWFVGEPSSAIYDYVKLGIWQLGEEEEAAVYGRKPGDIKLQDFAGGGENGDEPDGKITDADRKVLGSSEPDFQGGFTFTFAWKGLDLSVVSYFRKGGMIASTLHMPNDYLNRLDGRRNGIQVDYWTPENPTNDMPSPNVTIDASRTNVLGYFSGSFLKIRSINLGYNIPKRYTSSFLGSASGIRVYGSVVDPFILFSDYVDKGGVDPEPNSKGENANASVDIPDRTLTVGLNTPPTTKFIFGVNIKF